VSKWGWPDAPESPAGSNRYGWPDTIGTGGRMTPEYAEAEGKTDISFHDKPLVSIRNRFKAAVDRVGLKNVRINDLRHTAAV
jgi:hypothetical protein